MFWLTFEFIYFLAGHARFRIVPPPPPFFFLNDAACPLPALILFINENEVINRQEKFYADIRDYTATFKNMKANKSKQRL